MSFSSSVKEELSKLNNLANKVQVKMEFLGYLISSNTTIQNNKITYATESQYNINRFSKLLNNLNYLDYQIGLQGKIYHIDFSLVFLEKWIEIENNNIFLKEIPKQAEESKALIRGAFLGAGSINTPENTYHLGMNFENIKNKNQIQELLKQFNFHFKSLKKKKEYSLYLKEGEEISNFLAFIGANKAVLKFEEIRVQRDMNNKVNRLVNCETANLNKTINASILQIEAIEYLKRKKQFKHLEEPLKEIAEVRIKYPDMPLSELGKMLKNSIGKSGVNYRLKKIIEIAEELKKKDI